MDIKKEREAFERWFDSRYDAHFMQFALDLDMYVDKHTQTCWEAWQAAKAQAVPEGFILVPREPTLLMQRAGSAEAIKPNLGIVSMRDIYKAMIEAQEPTHD